MLEEVVPIVTTVLKFKSDIKQQTWNVFPFYVEQQNRFHPGETSCSDALPSSLCRGHSVATTPIPYLTTVDEGTSASRVQIRN
jgi:hypothetical protein